jgi:DNA-binding NarL/FixJ family response regulator
VHAMAAGDRIGHPTTHGPFREETDVDGEFSAGRTATRIMVADDDILLRAGVVSVLSDAGYDIIGQAGDSAAFINLLRAQMPDVAVIDIRMPPTHSWEGIELARTIRAQHPEVGILLLSAHVEVETAMDLLGGGQRIGYLLKSRITDVHQVIDAIERIAMGGSVIDPGLVADLFARRTRADPLAQLTPRELDVLALVAEGRSNAGIARQLFVTDGAVEKHVRRILLKLNLPAGDEDHRRVLAVLTFLDNR